MPDPSFQSSRCRGARPTPSTESAPLAALRTGGFLEDEQFNAAAAAIRASEDRSCMHTIVAACGAGKTRIGISLADYFLSQGDDRTVLWVSKKWTLLDQVRQELLTSFPEYRRQLRRVGGDQDCLRDLSTDHCGRFYLTSLQTWYRRSQDGSLPSRIRRSRNLLIIRDEFDWASTARMGHAFETYYLNRRGGSQNPWMVGLSATLGKSSPANCIYQIPFVKLVGTRLASPIVKNVQTQVVWDPILQNTVVTAESLEKLGSHQGRNELIVRELCRGWQSGQYKRIVVFACNVQHANSLTDMIAKNGISVGVIHTGVSKQDRHRLLEKFRQGTIAVLVNINMLVEGNNIPEIDAVFIARPTTSRQQLTQMIGRGSRRVPDKESFWIVEFTDVIRSNSGLFFHTSQLLNDSSSSSSVRTDWGTLRARPVRHAEPEQPLLETIHVPDLGAITIASEQTFGVEMELTSPTGVPAFGSSLWVEGAKLLIARLQACARAPVCTIPLAYHQNDDPTRWVVEADGSAGWEIVSPILVNAAGFEELRRVCEGLTQLVDSDHRFHINYRTGMHITLGTRLNTDRRLRGFVRRLQRLEPGLMTLVPPSRLFAFDGKGYDIRRRNWYCLPMRETIPDANVVRLNDFSRFDDRYYTVNLSHAYDDIQKLEVRLHSGTTEFRKVIPWISLWMLIFNHARYQWAGVGCYGKVFSGGNRRVSREQAGNEDLFELLRHEEIVLGPDLVRLLRRRRLELRPAWERVFPCRVEAWAAAGWYDDQQMALPLPLPIGSNLVSCPTFNLTGGI